jgi:hypothetical protein
METLHGNLTGHGVIKACGDRMLKSPGDVDRSTSCVTNVLARTEEVVRCLKSWGRSQRFIPSVSPSENDPMPAAVQSTGYARGLRLGGSRDPPAAFGVWLVTVWNAMVFE